MKPANQTGTITTVCAVAAGLLAAAIVEIARIIGAVVVSAGADELARGFVFDLILLILFLAAIYVISKVPFRRLAGGQVPPPIERGAYPFLARWLIGFGVAYLMMRFALVTYARPVGSAHHGAAFLALPFGLFVYFRLRKMVLGGADGEDAVGKDQN